MSSIHHSMLENKNIFHFIRNSAKNLHLSKVFYILTSRVAKRIQTPQFKKERGDPHANEAIRRFSGSRS